MKKTLSASLGSLSKHDVDGNENFIWKCNFAFLQSFFNYSVIMLEKCLLTVLELIWNQRLGHKKTKINICHRMLTSSTQLQNRSFHVVEKTRTSSKWQKMNNARAKRAKILFFIVKYANLWGFCCRRRRGCLSSLFKLNDDGKHISVYTNIQQAIGFIQLYSVWYPSV